MLDLAPFRVARWFDGTEVLWLVEDSSPNGGSVHHACETREEAVEERNRLNSKHALDSLGI